MIATGLLTDGPGWRWVFFINVPIGVLLITVAAIFQAVDARDRRRSGRFDIAGAVTVTAGLLLLVYALNRGADFGWGSGSTLGLFAASVVLLSAFVRIEARSRSPLVPGSSVRNRTLLLRLPRFAADATAAGVFADADGRRLAGHLGDVVHRGGDHGREAGCGGGRAAPAHRGPVAAGDLRAVADAGSGRRALRNRPAAGAAPVRRGRGLSAPSAQIGALSGVTHSMTGLASGLVETMREIGGAVGVAAVSTVLVSRAGELAGAADPAARGLAPANAFHAAFWVMFVLAALGAITAAIAFERRAPRQIEPEPAPSHVSIVPKAAEESA